MEEKLSFNKLMNDPVIESIQTRIKELEIEVTSQQENIEKLIYETTHAQISRNDALLNFNNAALFQRVVGFYEDRILKLKTVYFDYCILALHENDISKEIYDRMQDELKARIAKLLGPVEFDTSKRDGKIRR